VNGSADSGRGDAAAKVLRERLPRARIIELCDGDDLETALERAAGDAAILGVCGGDGTVNTAAGVTAAG
jgi:diacylglycerol kinase family enzyme